MGTPSATGCSLWLRPEGATHTRLASWIDRLAVRHGTEPFAPHLTLLSGLEGPEAEILATAARAAAALSPLTVQAAGIDGRNEHFRCLFLRAVASPALSAAHARAAHAFGRQPDPAFFPHLSLVYGSLSPEEKRALALELGRDATFRFTVRRLHVWRTDGQVASWRELGSLELGPRQGPRRDDGPRDGSPRVD